MLQSTKYPNRRSFIQLTKQITSFISLHSLQLTPFHIITPSKLLTYIFFQYSNLLQSAANSPSHQNTLCRFSLVRSIIVAVSVAPTNGLVVENGGFFVKIVLIGDSGVGKTCFVARFPRDYFNLSSKPIIGAEFATACFDVDSETVNAQIWDTAGQDRYRPITSSFYRGALAVMIVYDITNRATFESASRWLQEVHEHTDRKAVVMLVGNKAIWRSSAPFRPPKRLSPARPTNLRSLRLPQRTLRTFSKCLRRWRQRRCGKPPGWWNQRRGRRNRKPVGLRKTHDADWIRFWILNWHRNFWPWRNFEMLNGRELNWRG